MKSEMVSVLAMQVLKKLPCPYGVSLESGHVQAPQSLRHRTCRQH